CVVLYVCTSRAKAHLESAIKEWLDENKVRNCSCTIMVVQEIADQISVQPDSNDPILSLLEKYFDASIVDKHFSIGRHNMAYLGFDECGLPLVLSHNTPNNSVPLLWYEDDKKYNGLFPRVSRHR